MYIFYLSLSRLPIISVWFTISESFVGRYFSTHMHAIDMFLNGLRPTNKSKLIGSIDYTIVMLKLNECEKVGGSFIVPYYQEQLEKKN